MENTKNTKNTFNTVVVYCAEGEEVDIINNLPTNIENIIYLDTHSQFTDFTAYKNLPIDLKYFYIHRPHYNHSLTQKRQDQIREDLKVPFGCQIVFWTEEDYSNARLKKELKLLRHKYNVSTDKYQFIECGQSEMGFINF